MNMLEKLIGFIPDKRTRNVAMAVGGMGALVAGRKVVALGMFGKGLKGLEECWREAHPNFQGGWKERWEESVLFYESTHTNPVNRKLHVIGIPIILGGAAGLLLFNPYRPLWFAAAGAFAGGWALNIMGHAVFEKNAPAFADDPLSFVAGPVWDFRQVRRKGAAQPAATPEPPTVDVVNVGGATATA